MMGIPIKMVITFGFVCSVRSSRNANVSPSYLNLSESINLHFYCSDLKAASSALSLPHFLELSL